PLARGRLLREGDDRRVVPRGVDALDRGGGTAGAVSGPAPFVAAAGGTERDHKGKHCTLHHHHRFLSVERDAARPCAVFTVFPGPRILPQARALKSQEGARAPSPFASESRRGPHPAIRSEGPRVVGASGLASGGLRGWAGFQDGLSGWVAS